MVVMMMTMMVTMAVVVVDSDGVLGCIPPPAAAALSLPLSLSFFLSFPHGLALAWDLHTSIYLPTYYYC